MSEDRSMISEPGMLDVMEACADALLTACAASLRALSGEPPPADKCRELAIAVLDAVIVRTLQEGPP